MATMQKCDDTQDDLYLIFLELHKLLAEHKKQLEQAGISDELDKVMKWAEQAGKGDLIAEGRLEHEGFDLLKPMKDALKLTGHEYMDLENESPTIAPLQESAPQAFFEARNKIVEIIDTILQLKIKAEWKGAAND